jgi:flagellar motility protein MotE (MotC chaperone)
MIRYIRDLRLIPIALIASACLLALKTADIAFNGSALFARHDAPPASADVSVTRPMPDATAPPGSNLSWAQQMFNFPNSSGAAPLPSAAPSIAAQIAQRDNGDITGSVATAPAGGGADAAPNAKSTADDPGGAVAPLGKDGKPMLPAGGTLIPTNGAALPTGAERAILGRLQERREELDARARELDIRESLIQGAEKRMDAKLAQLKDVEAHIKVATQQKDDAEAARLKGLVTMYENMKAREAAKIFNGLDTAVLIEVTSQINPRQMAEILAQMSPDAAQRLTVELAAKVQQAAQSGSPADLPKIDGRPTPP